MSTEKPQNGRKPSVLGRGETLVAGAGLGAALVLLAGVGGAGVWTLHTNAETRREGREQTMRATAMLLSASAEKLISDNELGTLRTLVAGTTAAQGLRSVRIKLPEPQSMVVAEASPADLNAYEPLPGTWTGSAGVDEVTLSQTADARLRVMAPMMVPGRGALVLELEDNASITMLADWRMQVGIGAIGATALVALMAFYRSVRRRLRGLGAISEVLSQADAGERDPGALTISEDLGIEVRAFNALVRERAKLQELSTLDRVEQQIAGRRGRDGDLGGVCDAMWQGLLLIDGQMKVRYANGAAAVFLRAKREELVCKSIENFVSDAKTRDAMRSIAGGQTGTGTTRGRTVVELEREGDAEQSKSVLRFSVRPMRREDQASALVVIEDVTQQRVAEESRHGFVASATHELRTPLTNIRLYVDELLEDPEQDVNKRTSAMNVISQEVKRMERMVSDMLSVAQIESGTLKLNRGEVRLEPIFGELVADFAEQARQKDIRLKFDLPPKWPMLEGDRDKIVMAMQNLLGNAIKYTPAGGEVTVRVSGDPGAFSVAVIDNGIGIKEEEQPLVFERFYRAKDRRIENVTGTGLGLSIAREVVRLHGGDITVESALDRGSTFTMTLPAKAA